jgi:hypothetical protein
MAQLRGIVHGLAVKSRRVMMDELLFSSSSPASKPVLAVPWEKMRDNPTDKRPGCNSLKDHRTQMPVDGERWLFERVGQDAAIRDRFIKPRTQSGLDRKEVERYMDRVVAFREQLAVLMHIAGGQLTRGPELLSVQHSNIVEGGHRNIFIEDGRVVYVTRYRKGYNVSGDVKIIHLYLPREVGELLVYYMWLVLPFQQRLEAMVWEKETVSSHMWPADPNRRNWTSDRLREALKRESQAGLGQPLTLAAYREIAIGISRRFLRKATAFAAEEGDENKGWNEENMADLQAGHTAHVADHHATGKADMLDKFRTGRQRVVATSALGIGVGIADIQCIVHIDWPFSVLDYAQESRQAAVGAGIRRGRGRDSNAQTGGVGRVFRQA